MGGLYPARRGSLWSGVCLDSRRWGRPARAVAGRHAAAGISLSLIPARSPALVALGQAAFGKRVFGAVSVQPSLFEPPRADAADGPQFVPRPHQVEPRRDPGRPAAGRPGFLLGDMTGLGKTLSAWRALAAMPEQRGAGVCPKGAMPQWRRTIARSGLRAKAVTLINFEKTKSLMAPPAGSTRRSARAKNNELAKHGTLKRDLAARGHRRGHRIRNPNSQQGLVCRQMADAATLHDLHERHGRAGPARALLSRTAAGAGGGRPTGDLDEFRPLMKRLRSAGPRAAGRTGPGSRTSATAP